MPLHSLQVGIKTPLVFPVLTAQVQLNDADAFLLDGYTHVQTVQMGENGTGALVSHQSLTVLNGSNGGLMDAELTFAHPTSPTTERKLIHVRPVTVDPATGDLLNVGPDTWFVAGFDFSPVTGWQYFVPYDGNTSGTGLPGPNDPGGTGNAPPPRGTGGS